MKCEHCEITLNDKELYHGTEGDGSGYGHKGLCCDCFDLMCGMPREQLNLERREKGRPPIRRDWPREG